MKIGPIPILSIGFAIFLIAASLGYFHMWVPNIATGKNFHEAADKWETEANKLTRAVKRREEAQKLVQERADAWQKVVAVKTPAATLAGGGIDLGVNAYQLTVDSLKYRNSVQQAVNRQVKIGGVKDVLGGQAIPMPSEDAAGIVAAYFNYPVIPFPVVIYDLGTISVRGTWAQIKRNVEAWSEMPNYLAVASNLSMSGTGDDLQATYNVSIVGYLRGDKIYPGIPAGAAVATGGGGGGGAAGGGARGSSTNSRRMGASQVN